MFYAMRVKFQAGIMIFVESRDHLDGSSKKQDFRQFFLLGVMGYGFSVRAHDGIHALRTIFHVILLLGDAISDHLEG